MDSLTSKTWELNSYEIQRLPQKILSDNIELSICPRSLQSELMCPICLDILKSTMTTKECLHRFCAECIITALRSGNKECPTCRKKLISKRSLRQDPTFDAIIAKVFPCREEYEAHQEKVLAKLNRQHLNAALTLSLESNAFSKTRLRSTKPNHETSFGSEDDSLDSRRSSNKNSIDQDQPESKYYKNPPSQEIDILLKPQNYQSSPIENENFDHKSGVKYLQVPSIATITHLSEYLSMRSEIETTPSSLSHGSSCQNKENQDQIYKISLLNENLSQYDDLAGSLTIEEVLKKVVASSPTQTNLVLYYQKSPGNQ